MSEKKKFKTIDMIYVGLAAAIIAVCSWITIPIGAVPITLQTMAVCLIAGLFGLKRGTLATVVYICLGAIGVPVFSSFKSGVGVLAGPTGGYIIGFIFTALIVGFVSDKTKGKLWCIVVAMIIGIAVCYAFGTAWFYIYMQSKNPMSLGAVLSACVIPFLLPDAAKIVIAAVLTNRLKKFVK